MSVRSTRPLVQSARQLRHAAYWHRALQTSTAGRAVVQGPSALTGNGEFVRIVEVSPRDGLQNLPPPLVPTEVKRELVEKLLDAGIKNIEVGSFVRKDMVPQMGDTPELLPTLPKVADQVHLPVLCLNLRGLQNLLKLEEEHKDKRGGKPLTDEIAVVVPATDGFSNANNGAPFKKVLANVEAIVKTASENGIRTRGYVSVVMSCPYEGPVEPEVVVDIAAKLLEYGCYEVSLGDTTGEGNPQAWRKLWDLLEKRGLPTEKMNAHCHDTFSMAQSSILSLLPRGLRSVDSSLAGLGGCPYSPGATGNVATEDVVYALHKLGYQTGVDLDKLVEAGNWLCSTIGVKNESRVGRALWARKLAKENKAPKAMERTAQPAQ